MARERGQSPLYFSLSTSQRRDCPMSICQTCPLQEGGPHLYHIYQEDGWVRIREHQVFPGIWLAFKDAHTFAFSHHAAYPGGLLEITHCREGRLEYEDHCRSFFLGEGDLSIHESSCQGAVLRCPVKCFHGLSLIIHPEQAPTVLPVSWGRRCTTAGIETALLRWRGPLCGSSPSGACESFYPTVPGA